MDTATSDIRAVEFTPSSDGDSPVLPELLDQIPEGEEIGTVTADGAYDTRRCHTAIIDRQATAIIPIRKNGRPWKEDCPAACARNESLRATRHYGRAFWKRWTGYHARSRIEARMRCLKAFGERIAARDPDRQTAEIHIRVLRRLSRTDGVRLLSHEPLQRPRHRRDRSRRLRSTGKGDVTSQARVAQQRPVRGTCLPNWHGYVQAHFSASWRECRRGTDFEKEAAAF